MQAVGLICLAYLSNLDNRAKLIHVSWLIFVRFKVFDQFYMLYFLEILNCIALINISFRFTSTIQNIILPMPAGSPDDGY